jgi:hypothetical protein
VAEALGVTRGSVESEMRMTRIPPAARTAEAARPGAVRAPRVEGFARDLLRIMVHQADWRGRIAEQLTDRSALGEAGGRLFAALAHAGGSPAAELAAALEGEARELLAELLAEPPVEGEVDPVVDGALNALESRRLRAELDELQRTLAFKPEAEQSELLRRADTLTRQINRLSPAANWNVIRTGRSSAR